MTREELKEHCKRQIRLFEQVEKLTAVTPNDWKRYEEHKLILELLEQKPFINKPCVSEKACEHDKQKVLDKIRAEIEEYRDGMLWSSESLIKWEAINYILEQIIDKYKAESEVENEG